MGLLRQKLFLLLAIVGVAFFGSPNVAFAQEADVGDLADLAGGMPSEEGSPIGGDGIGETSPEKEEAEVPLIPYSKPDTAGIDFVELFDSDWTKRWVKSKSAKFDGVWQHARRAKEAIEGDFGLKVTEKAHHYGISASIKPPLDMKADEEFIVSYEAKFEDGLSCGGAYLKLFDASGMTLEDFDNDTPYSIMFGPDRCGATNKIHFIVRSQNPINGEWTEHHLTETPSPPRDHNSHLYTLRLLPNDKFDILVDNVSVKKGALTEGFEPPFTPPESVDDPTDEEPSDWVHEPSMPDPSAAKPDDWDEDAPSRIPDPEKLSPPEGWLEDEPTSIPNPDAEKPTDWDDEEDGEWTAPLLPNPSCSVGCGPWTPPTISNPEYKGKWTAPMIPNPDYKGVWAPQKIQNENYFKNENPHRLSMDINAVGFDLWSMDPNLMFDNVLVARNWNPVQRFFDQTFKLRKEVEDKQSSSGMTADKTTPSGERKLMSVVIDYATANPIFVAIAAVVSFFLVYIGVIKAKALFAAGESEEATTDKKTDGDKEEKATKTKKTKKTKAAASGSDVTSDSADENGKAKVKGDARKRAGKQPNAAD